MGIVRSRDELDYSKLDKLLKARGHGIINSKFFEFCNDVLDGKVKDKVIFQCDCGEVSCFDKGFAEKLIEKYGEEGIQCRKCNPEILAFQEGVLWEFKKTYRYLELITTVEKFLFKDRKPADEFISSINTTFPELVNAKSPNELVFQMHNINKRMAFLVYITKDDNHDRLINELVDGSKLFPDELYKVHRFSRVDFTQSRNTNLVSIQNEQFKVMREQIKFYNQSLPCDVEKIHGVSPKELEVNADLNLYNHMVEERKFLNDLFNVVKIKEGLPYDEEPFRNENVAVNGRQKRVKTLNERILAFNNYPSGRPVYLMLKEIFKNRLRNAHAHNDYEIVIEQKLIKHKDIQEIGEFYQMTGKFQSVRILFYMKLVDCYFEKYPPIRDMVLGYDKPSIEDGILKPAHDDTLPELHVEGYGFSERNIFVPSFAFHEGKLFLFSPFSINFYNIDDRGRDWLRQLIKVGGKYNVSYNSILDIRPENKINGKIIPDFDGSNLLEKQYLVDDTFLAEAKKIIDK